MVGDDAPYFAPRITEIAERHLGQGKKVGEISRAQVMSGYCRWVERLEFKIPSGMKNNIIK